MNMSFIRIGIVVCLVALLGAGCISKTKISSTGRTTTSTVPTTTLSTQPTSTTPAPATVVANSTLKRQIAFYATLTKKISEAVNGCLATVDAGSAASSTTDCLRVIAYHEFAVRLVAEPPLVQIRTNVSAAASAFHTATVEQISPLGTKFDNASFRAALKQYSEKLTLIMRNIGDLKKTYEISEQFEQELATDVIGKLNAVNNKDSFGIVASCGEDVTCFDQKFSACQKATLTANLSEKGIAYSILAPAKDGLCSVKVSEVLLPIEFLAPHTMTCSLVSNANFFEEMDRVTLELQKNPNQTACRGSMVADIVAAAKLFN